MRKLLSLLSIFAIVLSCSSDETSTPVTPPPAPIVKYTITLSAGEGGTVSTTGGEYEAGQTVSVTATPQGEYLFKDWSDGNTNATRTITVSSNSTLTANFEKRKYPLTINFEGEGEVIEEIINSGRTTEYDSGTTVKLTAQAAAEWVFMGWEGALNGTSNPQQLLISEPKEVTATFEKKKYPLTVNIEGEGEVLEEIVNTGRTTDYDSGTTVKLSAQPTDEWLFTGWSGDIGDIDPTENPIQLNIIESKTVTATFEKKKYPLTVNIEGEGEVLEEIVNTGRTTDYDSGTTVKLTAIPSEGWKFTGWTGAIESEGLEVQLLVSEAKEVNAEFKEKEPQYSIIIIGSGTFEITKINAELIKITPKPQEGWKFEKWNATTDLFLLINPYDANQYTLNFKEKNILENSFNETELTNFFTSLTSLSKEWIQSDVNSSNNFLMKYQNVSEVIWEELFNEYFSDNIFTEDLLNYLQYPAFWWLGDKVNFNIQKALYKPLTNKLLSQDNFIDNNEESKQILRFFGRYLENINQKKHKLSSSEFNEYIISNLNLFIQISNQKLLSNYVLVSDEKEKLADLKAQLYYVLSGIAFLDNNYKERVSNIISLGSAKYSSTKLSIWNKYTVLVNDNEFFNKESLEMFSDILNEVPRNFHQVTSFTNSNAMINPHKFINIGGFNVFDININNAKENGFPDDMEPFYGDLLYLVFVHELNHNVDSYYIKNDERINSFKNLILNQAGESQNNYLRSVIEEGYFVKYPQEFIASISNMYFVNSKKTFEVALNRAEENNYNPLNQFLLFAQVYSVENKIKFFKNSESIPLVTSEIVCEKDTDGFITSLIIDGKKYSFILNEDKTVKEFFIE